MSQTGIFGDLKNIGSFFEDYAVDLMVAFGILFFALMVGVAINGFLKKKTDQKFQDDDTSKVQEIFFRALHGVPISFSLVIGLYWVVNTAPLPGGLMKILSYILFASIIFTITRVVERTVSGFINLKFSGTDGETSQLGLFEAIAKIFIYASGMLIILQYYGISVAPIITAMGFGSMGLALGMQETLANIFAGLQIILSKQIQVNDIIKLNTGQEGRVVSINWRFTTVTPVNEGSDIVIPNKNIAGSITTNYTRPREDVVITVPIGVDYSSDLDLVERVTIETARKIMTEFDDYKPEFDENGKDINPMAPLVRYQEFADSSINFNAVLYATRFKKQFILKHEFIKAIKKRFDEEGINIPFPVRTLVNQTEK